MERKDVREFKSLEIAKRYCDRTIKPSKVLHGNSEDEVYWVASLSVASQLVKEGYEIIY